MGLKFEIERESFAKALGAAQHLTQRRTLSPILSHIHLRSQGDNLELYATDFEIAIEKRLFARILEPGEAAMPGRLFYDVVHRGKGEKVTFQVDERFHGQILFSDRSKYKLVGMNPEEFPPRTQTSSTPGIPLKARDLLTWIEKTLFAASPDDSRPTLAGVYLEKVPQEGSLNFVATDTHRLALLKVPLPEPRDGGVPEEGTILPRRALQELPRMMEADWTVELSFAPPFVSLTGPDTRVIFRTVEGKFPAYRNVIPQGGSRTLWVNCQELIEALERVSLLIPDRFKGIRVQIEKGQILLHAHHPEAGEGEEVVEAEVKGEPLVVGFNATYLKEPLEEIQSERVEIRLNDESAPVVILPEGDESYLNVIMPMRL